MLNHVVMSSIEEIIISKTSIQVKASISLRAPRKFEALNFKSQTKSFYSKLSKYIPAQLAAQIRCKLLILYNGLSHYEQDERERVRQRQRELTARSSTPNKGIRCGNSPLRVRTNRTLSRKNVMTQSVTPQILTKNN